MEALLQQINSKTVTQQALIMHEKENKAFARAHDIQKEMVKVRQEKAEIMTNIFLEHLRKEAVSDLAVYDQKLEEKQKQDFAELEKRKSTKSKEIDALALNVREQIKTLNMMLEDLLERKDELETSYHAALEYLKAERNRSLENYRLQIQKESEDRVKIFKRELAETFE